MLKRFVLAASPNKFPESVGFRLGERAIEVQVQLHARHFQHLGQKQFCLKTRRIDVSLRQKIGTFLNGFEDRHVETLKWWQRHWR